MLTLADFFDVVRSSVPQFKTKWLDRERERVVSAPTDPPALVVAGPGARKTTVLALRVLKHVFVSGMKLAGVIAMTFTRKAAKERRSRLLSWGIAAHNEVQRRAKKNDLSPLPLTNRLCRKRGYLCSQFELHRAQVPQVRVTPGVVVTPLEVVTDRCHYRFPGRVVRGIHQLGLVGHEEGNGTPRS